MKKTIIVLSLIAVSALSGCSNVQMDSFEEYKQKTENMSSPAIGLVSTAYMGDNMVDQGMVTKAKMIKTSGGKAFNYKVKAGEAIIELYNDKYFWSEYTKLITDNGGNTGSVRIGMNRDTNQLCVLSDSYSYVECNDGTAEIIDKNIESINNFQQNLIYLGMPEANKITIGYREFKSRIARDAFSNDITYNLDLTNEIAYKGAVIEIISATPSKIKYIVKHNFK